MAKNDEQKLLVLRPSSMRMAATMMVFLVGCGGEGQKPAADPAGETATGDTLTEFQKSRLLGHYSAEDGQSGFILDRTKTPWKAKLDGGGAVLTLSASHGPYETMEYRGQDFWIRVDKDGEVVLFDGPRQTEGVRVVRDANANQL